MKKRDSFFRKVNSLLSEGLSPMKEGKKNYELDIPEIEETARKRAEICSGCDSFVDEPIDFWRIKDSRIVELSEKACMNCGCPHPYLLRQSQKICDKWNEEI